MIQSLNQVNNHSWNWGSRQFLNHFYYFAGFIFLTELKWIFTAMIIGGLGVGIAMNLIWIVIIQIIRKELYVYIYGIGAWLLAGFFLISGPIIGNIQFFSILKFQLYNQFTVVGELYDLTAFRDFSLETNRLSSISRKFI